MWQSHFTDRWLYLALLAYLWQASGKIICRKSEKLLDNQHQGLAYISVPLILKSRSSYFIGDIHCRPALGHVVLVARESYPAQLVGCDFMIEVSRNGAQHIFA